MKTNPYTLVFGKQPIEIVPRIEQTQKVLRAFTANPSPQQVFIATGVRGCGKTVFMSTIAKELKSRPDWIVVQLNPDRDLLQSLAARLYSDQLLIQLFRTAKIDLSLFGIGVKINDAAPISDIEYAIAKMLEEVKKAGKRLLITIDEASNTDQLRVFASAFQILVREELPVYLLMTGLYENIDALQNEKNLTFLHRAPKINLEPLNIGTMALSYQNTFEIGKEEALRMAQSTKGYSFAFQILGYFTWEYRGDPAKVHREYKQYLEEYSYNKIWSELSSVERKVLYALAKDPAGQVSAARERLGCSPVYFAQYRNRLIKRGVLVSGGYGVLLFTLPLFSDFVLENAAEGF